MSVLSGGSGSPVKSVQRGVAWVSGAETVIVSEVNMAKSLLSISHQCGANDYRVKVRCVLETATSISLNNLGSLVSSYTSWELVEYV